MQQIKEMGAAEVTILLLFYIKWRNPKRRTVILVGRVKNLSEEGEGKKKCSRSPKPYQIKKK